MKTLFLFLLTGLAVISLTRSPLAGPVETISTGTRAIVTGAGHSFLPAISGDGRVVLFFSQANNLVTNDNRLPHLDLFVRDLSNGVTRLVSVNTAGAGGAAGDSGFASISSNGQFVVFANAANDLVQGDTNSRSDVFVRDTASGVTRLVSINAAGTGSTFFGAGNPAMSRDGRWVAFESISTELGPPKQYIVPIPPADVFVRDVWSNVTVMASVNRAGDGGGSASSVSPVITPDGRYVAFVSQATNLVTGVTNKLGEIYVRDLQSNTTTWASAGASAFLQSSNTYKADQALISDDGRFVAFTAGARLFHYNLQSSSTTVVADWGSTTIAPDFRASLSPNGRFVAYQDGTNVWVTDVGLATNTLVSVGTNGTAPTDGVSFAPSISADGQRVIFFSSSSGLVTNLVNGRQQIYVRDLAAGTTRLVSANVTGTGANGDQFPGTVAWSDDGNVVTFESPADDLVNDDLNQASDVFVRHLDAESTELLSRRLAAKPSATSVAHIAIGRNCVSSNASMVLFRSEDNSLVAGDTNGWADLFARDSASGEVVPITLTFSGTNEATYPLTSFSALSANGRYAAWTPGGSPPLKILRRDLLTGNLDVVTTNATAFTSASRTTTNLFAISPDGNKIAYERVEPGASQYPSNQVFIRDLIADTDTLISSNRWKTHYGPRFSPDGRWVFYLGQSNATVHLFGCDLLNQQTRMISTNLTSYWPAMSEDFAISSSSEYLVCKATDTASTQIRYYSLSGIRPNRAVCAEGFNPSVSADGRFVAYARWDSFAHSYYQIYVKDLQTDTEELVGAGQYAADNSQHLIGPFITPDGRLVVYSRAFGAVVAYDTNRVSDIFVRDRLLKTTICLSVNQLGVPASGSSGNPILSGDGRTVVFQSTASDLVFADYNDKRDVFAVRIGHDDTDSDGLDDDWEMAYFGNLSHDGTADSDGDGVSDRAEFLAGTDPTNLGSVLRATTLVPQGGGNIAILWQAVPGRTYQVQFKNSLSDANWSVLPGTVTATTTTGVMTDATAGGTPQRFYRVTMAP